MILSKQTREAHLSYLTWRLNKRSWKTVTQHPTWQIHTKWSNKSKQWNCPKCYNKISNGKSATKNHYWRTENSKSENPTFLHPTKNLQARNSRKTCHRFWELPQTSEYADYHLQPIAKEIPFCIEDKTDFLRKLQAIESVPNNSYFVSLDIKSLHTGSPNAEVIKAVKAFLGNFPKKTVATKFITTFLALILAINNFMFNFKNYLQIKECVMGTISAPSYANIFYDHFEIKYISLFLKVLSILRLSAPAPPSPRAGTFY